MCLQAVERRQVFDLPQPKLEVQPNTTTTKLYLPGLPEGALGNFQKRFHRVQYGPGGSLVGCTIE